MTIEQFYNFFIIKMYVVYCFLSFRLMNVG